GSPSATFTVSATDDCSVTTSCAPASGATFTLGDTRDICIATDGNGNSSNCSFSVRVVDTTEPIIACPDPAPVECTSPSGAAVSFDTTASDVCDASPQLG